MQQINLYQEQFKQRRQISLLTWVCYGLVLVLVVMAAVTWMEKRAEYQLQQCLQKSNRQHQQLLTSIAELEQRMAALKPQPQLQKKLQQLRNQLQQRQPLRIELERLVAQKDTIPQAVNALAAQPLRQLWLEKVEFLQGGGVVRLQGLALRADVVPDFIEQLTAQRVFGGKSFAQLGLEQQKNGRYRFVLSTTMEPGQ